MNSLRWLSTGMGFFFGLMAYVPLRLMIPDAALPLAILSGLLFAGLLSGALGFLRWKQDMAYARFEETILSPVFWRTEGNFHTGTQVRYGRIYFCEDGILCVSQEGNPCTLDQIPNEEIVSAHSDSVHLVLQARDGRLFLITTPDAAHIVQLLKDRSWIG